jgi:hypothetical protein
MKNTTATSATTPSRRRIRRAAGSLLAASILALGATACEPTGCQLDCITSVSLDPGATKATVATTVPTTAVIQLYTDPAMTKLAAQRQATTPATTHAMPVGQLFSSTTYWWRLTAVDENQVARTETGTVKTFRRQVTVKVDRIKVIDDSDAAGTGELQFHLGINGTAFTSIYVNGDLGTGADVKNLGINRTLSSAGSSLQIRVEGQDDDCDVWDGLCSGGTAPSWTSGSSSTMDWATASFGPVGMPATNGSGSWSAKTTTHKLKFEVFGTWSVSYHAI